jgi:anti-anti-sigma factor
VVVCLRAAAVSDFVVISARDEEPDMPSHLPISAADPTLGTQPAGAMIRPDARPDLYPSGFGISAERVVGGAIVTVEGNLDRGTVEAVAAEARCQIGRHGARLVLDLSGTTFIDAAAITLMDTLSARTAALGGTLVIVLTCPRARWLLELFPAREPLRIVGSVSEATAAWPGPGLAQAG